MARNPNLRFSRKFYGLGAALAQGGSLAAEGANKGSLAVAFDALGRVGSVLVNQGFDQHAAAVLKQAKANGASEADQAALAGRMVKLRQDETLAAQKFNNGARQAYLSQLKDSMQSIGKVMAVRYPTDPVKFGQDFTNATNALVDKLPPEWKDGVARTMRQYGGQLKASISAAALKKQYAEQNAILATAQDKAYSEGMQAFRDGNQNAINNALNDFVVNLTAQGNLSPQQIADAKSKFYADGMRNQALGGFDRVLAKGGFESADAYIKAFRADKKTIVDPTQRDRVAAEMAAKVTSLRQEDKASRKAQVDAEKNFVANMLSKTDAGNAQAITATMAALDGIYKKVDGSGQGAVDARATIAKAQKNAQQMLADIPKVRAARSAREAVATYPDLYQKAAAGDLTLEQFDAAKRGAILAGASKQQLQLLNGIADTITKRDGGPSGLRSDKVYSDIVTKIQGFGIKNKAGAIAVSGDAPASGLIELQRQVIEAANLGQISNQEAQSFLTKIIPSMTQQIAAETGQPVFGFGGGPTDIYDAGFEAITQLLKKNNQENDIGLKTALFRTFVFRAEALNIAQQQDPAKRADLQDALARQISTEYAKKIAPSLAGLSPDSLPNGIFVDGKLYNIFDGLSAAPTATVITGIETRRLKDGSIVQVLKGTNTLVRVISKGSG